MFITPAMAADTATTASAVTAAAADPSAGFSLLSYLPMLLVIVIFYIVVIRPQNKRAAEHRSMITALQKGDKVITGGGLIAKVSKVVSDEEVVLELAEGVHVHALRATIMMKKD